MTQIWYNNPQFGKGAYLMLVLDWRPITNFLPERAGMALIEIQLHLSTPIFASVLKCLGEKPTEQNVNDIVYFILNEQGEIEKFSLKKSLMQMYLNGVE